MSVYVCARARRVCLYVLGVNQFTYSPLIDMPINNQYFGDAAPEQSLVLFMVYRYID